MAFKDNVVEKIIAILKNIVSNKKEVERGDQLELSFSVEFNDANKQIFTKEEMKTYTVDEVAELINKIDVDSLDESDIEYIKSLYRKFESDNVNSNVYKNEEALIAPLFQKINEYDHVINEEDFNSNQKALEELTGHNNNLSTAKLISLKSNITDSKHNLDYLRIVNDGVTELISITDPDYLERFANEFASEIIDMSSKEFTNRLKFSTESALEFVELDKYLNDNETSSKMPTPALNDKKLLIEETEEVKRLVEKFMPNEEIYIAIDDYGEIFYKVRDGIIKGRTEDGERKVDFCVVPSSLISNEKTIVEETKTDNNE